MGNRLKNLAVIFSDMKARTIILATAGILFLALIIGIIGINRTSNSVQSQANLQQAPQGIQSTPGLKATSPEYSKLQGQLNLKRRQQAEQNSQSFVPTVINKTNTTGNNQGEGLLGFNDNANGDNTGTTTGSGTPATSSMSSADADNFKAQLSTLQKQMSDQQQQLQTLNNQQLQQAQQTTQQNMTTEAQALTAAWTGTTGTPTQSYVQGTAAADLQKQQQVQEQAAAAAAAQPLPPIVKAGTILFASLNTSVDSDEPGPVLATIVTGQFMNAKLIGSIQQASDNSGLNRPTRVELNFTTMNLPDKATTIAINAVAIDPDTARTALASDVDHHYLLRYGSMFGSAFLEGYGNAITQSGSTTTNFVSGGQTTVAQQLNPWEEVAAGFGQVGQQWGQQMNQIFNRPNTITVNAGTSVGILFLSDVTLDAPSIAPRLPAQAANTTSYESSSTTYQSTAG